MLQILPLLSPLAILGGLYGLYLLYLGLPRLMKPPADKALDYTVVVVISAIVVTTCLSVVTALVGGFGLYSSGALSGIAGGRNRSSWSNSRAFPKRGAMPRKPGLRG